MRFKVESARRQLGTALHLFLEDQDPVSVHALAGGGCEVIEHFAAKAGAPTVISYVHGPLPPEQMTALRRAQRQFWSAFKHALSTDRKTERDDEALLEKFDDAENDIHLFVGWTDYGSAAGKLPIEAQVFQIWFMAGWREGIRVDELDVACDYFFPNLNRLSRPEKKKRLRAVIESQRNDPKIMGDPKTDSRPLVLPWP